eukprot:CAMPEP_0119434756 /NCGR_PEP_ID=MMETSP1335-20130426/50827_1 /TAXON_ID=259385 /ORGANISM="Chrysoculter rhomboideus, Strain RCC1486" /LENGTH=30 /DNA_ID= /DNA_START= /DNA_END= /DNA_ORIENTATION=
MSALLPGPMAMGRLAGYTQKSALRYPQQPV